MLFGWFLGFAGCATPPGTTADTSVDTPAPEEVHCESVLQEDGSPAGLEWCWRGWEGYGYLNRTSIEPCVREPIDPVGGCYDGLAATCADNSDCGPTEICSDVHGTCDCTPLCSTDADCGADTCLCDVPDERVQVYEDRCLTAGCRTGADCASGVCGVSLDGCGWFREVLACRSDADECLFDRDCADSESACRYDGDAERWQCVRLSPCE